MICDECQTLAHCMNHGCIPITEEKSMHTRPTPLHTRNGGNVVEDGNALKRRKQMRQRRIDDLFYEAFFIAVTVTFGIIAWLQNSP